ncbi:branched-chain alpha-keto acid dehydrogenase subunit E2 [Moraxellaceae bacterium AER2_44_116]|nr:2-oxo acid dehydrogenase subunit E2 [Moraxellaceae bacterium]TQC95753.1 branched-chain alpha-keto acid dehydrogenase subunit E2 [Moraxellaceae bacterium AER2_44_116]
MLKTISAPDLGTDKAEVIEILVKVGQVLAVDTPIVLLESAKASMEVPCPMAGVVTEILVKLGDNVSEGTVLVQVEVAETAATAKVETQVEAKHEMVFTPADEPVAPVIDVVKDAEKDVAVDEPVSPKQPSLVAPEVQVMPPLQAKALIHCGPAVRRLARELGVDLQQVQGTASKGRIVKDDVHAFVKKVLTTPPPAIAPTVVTSTSGLPALPDIDFSKWGDAELKPLTKIQKLSAQNLHRAWLHIPHVTQFDEADITELEAFRVAQKDALKAQGISLTILSFLVKACAYVLKQYPKFNASLSKDGEQLILKKYIHIGVAVDTPNGLVVPVIRNADQKSISAIAKELGELSAKARDKKLSLAEMQGASFSISSLGGIGGTAFTPIVNWPEVAILGVSRASQKPVWNGQTFVPRLLLPLSLSYDHRVVDGADGARFITALGQVLADIRRVLL